MQVYCKHGHEYTSVNTGRDKHGHRYCKTCNRLRGRKRSSLCMKNIVRRRRDRVLGLDLNYTSKDELVTRLIFNNQCFKCKTLDRLEIDHHHPLIAGFGLKLDNAVLLCRSCNASKNDSPPESFYSVRELEVLEFLLCYASF